jgi:L-threonylcarbamoyladenylate synthase
MTSAPIILPPNDDSVAKVAAALAEGQLCVIPTDTVYGLAAQIAPEPVARLYVAKGRPEEKPIPVLVSGLEPVRTVAPDWPEEAQALARAFWPGPLTLVVPAAPGLPRELTAGTGTVGVRWPANTLATSVIERAGGALAVTSANRSGEPQATSAEEAARMLRGSVAYVLDGGSLAGHRPSTVVSVTDGELRVLRTGPISLQALRDALARAIS